MFPSEWHASWPGKPPTGVQTVAPLGTQTGLEPGGAGPGCRVVCVVSQGAGRSGRWWAKRVREWLARDHDVYGYPNNDGDANAVRNARTLRTILEA